MNQQNETIPTSFRVVGIIAILWNLFGMLSFFGQVFMSEEALLALPEDQRVLYEAVPAWVMVVFAIAVFGGTLGSIGLLMKKNWSVTLLLASLIAVVIQMSYNVFVSDSLEVFGPAFLVMPIMITAIAGLLYWYSRRCQAKGWLT